MSVLTKCMSMYHTCVWWPWKLEAGVRSPGIGVVDNLQTAMWVLGNEPGSSRRAVSTLNY